MMTELSTIHKKTAISETLIVVDAMTGQEALNIAAGFHKAIPLTGILLTKMEGDACHMPTLLLSLTPTPAINSEPSLSMRGF